MDFTAMKGGQIWERVWIPVFECIFEQRPMDNNRIVFWLTVLDTVCWGLCFWWMHRISSRQDALLAQLQEQGRRIEKLSKAEHDLIKEVHPQVGEIKEVVQEVVEAVKEDTGTNASTVKSDNAKAKRSS
jgi:cell division protein FtsB